MRNSVGGRLRKTDFKKLQKSAIQKTDKQVQVLIQLIDLPDYDVSQFFQALLKNQNYTQILERIPKQKQIDFFSRNFETFLQTQQQLEDLQLPLLDSIPNAKQYHVKQMQQVKQQLITQESSVINLIDSFSSYVLERNNTQIVRIFELIKDMKNHNKYEIYFNQFSIAKTYRQYYNAFVESCTDYAILIRVGQKMQAIKVYLKSKTQSISQQIQTNLNISSQVGTIQKQLYHLIKTISLQLMQIKKQFGQVLIEMPQIQVYISKWISQLSQKFYHLVQPLIYQKQQLSQVLNSLGSLIQTSKLAYQKQISLQRQLKTLISSDLPLHMQKVVQVVLQAFQNLLKDDNQLYQFIYFQTIKSFSQASQNLIPIDQNQYHKKCATQKGIFLINSFMIILQPICQSKWEFLQENTLNTLLEKIQSSLNQTQLHYWDYYHLYKFFQQLNQGKIGKKKLRHSKQLKNVDIADHLLKAYKISKSCWLFFELKITRQFFKNVLWKVPQLLWHWRKHAEHKQPQALTFSSMSFKIIKLFDDFLKQVQFRIKIEAFQFLLIKFHEYLLHTFEYVLYYAYHKKGTVQKTFLISKMPSEFLDRVKQFTYQDIPHIKDKKILQIEYFTKSGLRRFLFQVLLISQVLKKIFKTEKAQNIKVDQFHEKVIKVFCNQKKLTQKINFPKSQFQSDLAKSIQIYTDKLQILIGYFERDGNGHSSSNNYISSQSFNK